MNISQLTSEQCEYLDSCLSIYHRLVQTDAAPDEHSLQAIFEWCRSQDWTGEEINEKPQALALAAGFGDLLCRQFSLKWVWCEDEEVSDLALQVEESEAVIWPFAMVIRRLLEADDTSVPAMVGGIEVALRNLPEVLGKQ